MPSHVRKANAEYILRKVSSLGASELPFKMRVHTGVFPQRGHNNGTEVIPFAIEFQSPKVSKVGCQIRARRTRMGFITC